MTVGIVDYGMGNLLSVLHAVEAVGGEPVVCRDPGALHSTDRIILPGVGAFRDCIRNLAARGFVEVLRHAVLVDHRPIMGICLGMHAMAAWSEEGGERCAGLGWIAARVVRLNPAQQGLRVPQIGWNDVAYARESPLFRGLPDQPEFYFVHSYHVVCDDEDVVEATCDHGEPVTAAIRWNNVFATQFHPEKSQDHGLRLLENFLEWRP
jgi:glutamine amidotransferase